MPVPFFDLNRQNQSIKSEINAAIQEVITSGKFILGPNVSAFEKEIATYCGTKFAIGVASGTDALLLGLLSCGIKTGDEVICPPFTFIATAEAIAYIGAKPVFVDINPDTFNIDPEKIESAITNKTKAIVPVHLFGQSAEMDKILQLAKKYNLKIIEDCAQAIGAEYLPAGRHGKNAKVGSIGDVGCFSFFPTKNLGGFGDGGMITTNNPEIDEKIRILRGHGSKITYKHDVIGYNSRLDDIQAAALRVKLHYLDQYAAKRQQNALQYDLLLKCAKSVKIPVSTPNYKHVYNQYTIRIMKPENRNQIKESLSQKGVGSNIYYPLSLHLQKAFTTLGYKQGDFPESERAQDEVLSLPIFPELTEAEIKEVAQAIAE